MPIPNNNMLAAIRNNQHENGANDNVITLDEAVVLNPEHAAALKETQTYTRQVRCIRDHNRRISSMIDWIREHYPTFFESMCRPLTDAEKAEGDTYYQATHDFVYERLDPTLIQGFISCRKVKYVDEDGANIIYSYDHLRRYKDAVIYGSKRAKKPLSSNFHLSIKDFLDTLKKENQQFKKKGQVDETESDPICAPLYKEIAGCAVRKGYIQAWVFTVLQWNCMARSKNIDGLTWNCFGLGKDCITIKFWDTKSDPKGEKCTPKHCFSNPFDHRICVTTALGAFLSINDEKFANKKDTIFLNKDARSGNAKHAYVEQINKVLDELGDLLWQWVRPGHIKDHGFRKGAATECTAGTTCAPSPSAVAQRGEWSIGKVFDIYWLFAEAGDQYCGRILAGLDSMSTTFDALPPHFVVGMEDERIVSALKKNFHYIYKMGDENEEFANVKNLLLRCLASLVHHSDALIKEASNHSSHPFWKIPMLCDRQMINELKQLVTTNASHVIDTPTGIPPHVKQNKQLADLLILMKAERDARMKQEQKIEEWIHNAIEKNAFNNGNVTYANLSSMLKVQQDSMKDEIDRKLDSFLSSLDNRQSVGRLVEGTVQETSALDNEEMVRRNFHYWKGKYWHVPENWSFPDKCLRRRGWELWLIGLPNFHNEDGNLAPIMPFRRFNPKFLPKKIAVKFKTEWRVIYSKMMEGVSENVRNANLIDNDAIEKSFQEGTLYLKDQICSYVFTKDKFKNHQNWTVGTWSKRLSREMILMEGSENDIANLPEPSHNNGKRKRA
jgi:hypothetical protein